MDEAGVAIAPVEPHDSAENKPWWRSPRFTPLALALLAVVVAHGPYLLGAFDPNPALATSGLALPGAHSLLPGRTSIDPNAGFTSQANGHRAALDWIHGLLPWWNPWEGAGNALAGGLSSAAFFLPFVLFTLIPSGQVLMYLILDLIATAATFALLRGLGLNRWAAAAAAVAFGLNGTNAWFRFVADNPVAFLPLLLLGIERVRLRAIAGKKGGWALVAGAVALSLLASFPETAYLDGVVAVVWLAVRCGGAGRSIRWLIIRRAATGVVVGVALAAPLLIAFFDFLATNPDLGRHAQGGYAAVHTPTQGLISIFAPYGLGPIFGFSGPGATPGIVGNVWGGLGGYSTAACLVVAAMGLFGRNMRALRLCLGAVVVIFLGRSFGFPGAAALVNVLPGASSMAVYRYDSPAIEMAIAVLIGFAIDDVVRQRRPLPSLRRCIPIGVGIVLLAGGWLAVRSAGSLERLFVGSDARIWWEVSLLWAIGSGVVAVGCFCLGSRRFAAGALVFLVSAEAIAMFALPEFSAPRGATLDSAAITFLRSHVGTSRFFSFGPFQPNYGSYFGVGSADINELPLPAAYQRYVTTAMAPNADPLLFNGIEVLDPAGPTPIQQLGAHLAGYRHLAVDYLVFLPGELPTGLPAGALTLAYHDSVMDIYHLAGAEAYATTAANCTIVVHSTQSIDSLCPQATTLLRREVMMPGWTATVNGRATAVKASKQGLQLVSLPAGHCKIAFSFSPPHESLGWLAFAAGLVALVLGPIGRARPKRSAVGRLHGPAKRPRYQPMHRGGGVSSRVRIVNSTLQSGK